MGVRGRQCLDEGSVLPQSSRRGDIQGGRAGPKEVERQLPENDGSRSEKLRVDELAVFVEDESGESGSLSKSTPMRHPQREVDADGAALFHQRVKG